MIDEKEIRKRFDRISAIFSDIVSHADETSQTRCPYRDRFDRCTGKFRCRNQLPRDQFRSESDNSESDNLPYLCTHDGRFDYRAAWETHPRSYDKAKDKIQSIRRGAERRRKGGNDADT